MKKRDTAKKVQAKSCLTVSDWLTFLSSERQGMAANIVNLIVFLVAAIALIVVASAHAALAVVGAIVVFGSAGWAYFRVLGPLRQRAYLADYILKAIISRKLKDVDSIRAEWELGMAVISRGWFCRQYRARLAVLKRAWWHEWKPRLVAFQEASRDKCQEGVVAVRETWRKQKATLVTLKRAWQTRWQAALAALREAWCQEKARLAALAQTWRLW